MLPTKLASTVYVPTVPANVTGQYLPGGEGILSALNAKTGALEWSWNSVQNLWGNARHFWVRPSEAPGPGHPGFCSYGGPNHEVITIRVNSPGYGVEASSRQPTVPSTALRGSTPSRRMHCSP